MLGADEPMNLDEIVATGELYKQGSGRKNWCLRKFILSGIYLIYFNRKGEKKGQWDITECVVKKVTPEECNMPAAKHAFALIGPRKYYLACASSEKNRHAWMTVIDEQIEEFKEDIRRFLRSGEVVHGNAIVRKKNMLGISSNVRLLLTNFPRIMVIEPASLVLKEQMSWGRDFPPSFLRMSDTKFKISLNGKDMIFEDLENGTKYWEDIFRRFPNMKYYVHKAQKSLNIDFHDFVDPDEDESLKKALEAPVQRSPADMAREAKNKENLKFLEEALNNIGSLVTALSSKIDALDEEEETAKASGVNNPAAAQERANKRAQLQILKDNVTVLSANLQSLVTRSVDTGVTDFDINAIQSVIEETASMLLILNSGDEDVFQAYEQEALSGADIGDQVDAVNEIVENVEWMVLEDNLTSEAFAQLDSIQDLEITADNFDPNDPSKRPKNWNEVRLKRVMIKEHVDRLEGVPEAVILERRAKRLQLEERLMVQEVAERGRLLNMPVLRRVQTPSQRAAIAAAAMAITDDNFDPNTDRRPLAWQAVKLRRVHTKEDIYRRQGRDEAAIQAMHDDLMVQEEKIMLGEVAKFGEVTSYGMPLSQDGVFRAGQMVINAQTFDPKDPKKRPTGWFEIRRQRVLVKEQIDRLNGVDEQTIYDNRPQRERDEEALMVKEAMTGRRVLSVRYEGGEEEAATEGNMRFNDSNFNPSDPNKRPKGWFEIRQRRVAAKEQVDRLNGVSDETIQEMHHQRELEEEALMLSEVSSGGRLLTAEQRAKVNMEVKITKTNFSATDATKRPKGWAELRLKRVMLKEHIDRIAGIDEENISDMRSDREIQEEALMIDEVLCLGRVLGVGESSRNLIPYVPTIVFKPPENFDPADPERRPKGWFEARAKRVMMKEQADRFLGVSEEAITAKHVDREAKEEELMLEEVATWGHLVGVGGPASDNDMPLKVPVIVVSKENFDPNMPSKRPDGWVAARKKRVYKKEQLDRLRGVTEAVIEEKRRQREIDEEKIMMDEVSKHGHLIGIGGPPLSLVQKNVNDSLDINDANFDATTGMRPKGWAEVKMRRVYLKEWKDRRDGVDEEEILARRPARELEVEKEMMNEASVFGRVHAIEKRIKANKAVKPIFPKGYKGHIAKTAGGATSTASKAANLQNFISAANVTLESLSDKVAETLAEKVLGETPGNRTSRTFRNVPQASAPKIIAPAMPRGRPPMPNRSDSSQTSANLLAARNRAQTLKSDLAELGINDSNFDVNDPRMRPPGWAEVRSRRVDAMEAADRAKGIPQSVIDAKREARETKEEENMCDEVAGRKGGSAPVPVLPTSFRSNLIASKGQSSRGLTAKILQSTSSTR